MQCSAPHPVPARRAVLGVPLAHAAAAVRNGPNPRYHRGLALEESSDHCR
ncbi:hypothetical protein LP415_00625 [Polaromonas sp. P1(28)-8]|nr:hypothetical protein LP415_00625 [Polaromonas sp. P1(28)-8]